jgi:uncharacterized membrane protein YphA (DoxX/SURF4 family)
MSHTEVATKPAPNRALVWIGRILTLLIAALFAFSGVMKLMGGPELEKGVKEIGLPMSMVLPLGIVELSCVAIYLIPQTAIVGAILLTGYIGGALCTHWRVGQPFYLHIVIGVCIWLAVFLREQRLRSLIPLRTPER